MTCSYHIRISTQSFTVTVFFSSATIILVILSAGNKSDRTDREITQELGRQFAQENDMPFLETSAKNSNNIDELFLQLAKTLRESHVDKRPRSHGGGGSSGGKQPNTVTLTQKTSSEQASGGGGGCCWFFFDFISFYANDYVHVCICFMAHLVLNSVFNCRHEI